MLKRLALVLSIVLLAAACSDSDDASEPASGSSSSADTTSAVNTTDAGETPVAAIAGGGCDATAALFITNGSANADLPDPVSSAVCDGDTIVVSSNGIPDYTYIESSPGTPAEVNLTFNIRATPVWTEILTDVPALGSAAVALNGVAIYGPTEAVGGDVLSLVGALSECGSHNGPTGFHIHLFGTSSATDCIFTPEEVAAEPQLLGYALDGYPIYTGKNFYTSSWALTDDSLFASDTWSAHSFTEGSGDLDQCNGLTDADGSYAYYTTDSFPYILGCYHGEVDLYAAGGGGGELGNR
jgi:hypothetical protein